MDIRTKKTTAREKNPTAGQIYLELRAIARLTLRRRPIAVQDPLTRLAKNA